MLTFNIRYGNAPDGDHSWPRRRELVIERIRAHDPDLIGLQECRDDEQAAFVRASLPEYEFYGVPRGGDGPTALEMAPLLARRSAFDWTRRGCFWLSETPELPGSLGWDALFPRTATWAELVHRATGRPLTFLNTHFDIMPQAIVGAARQLRQWAELTAARLPVVISGDFNAGKSSAAYEMLADGRALADAGRPANAPGDDEATYHDFGRANPPQAIDWLLASPSLTVVAATIDRTRRGDLFPSDHYPVAAALRWKDEG